MILYDNVKTICKMIKENIGFRDLVLFCENEQTRIAIRKRLSEYGYEVNFEICSDDKQVNNKTIFSKEYIEKNGGGRKILYSNLGGIFRSN